MAEHVVVQCGHLEIPWETLFVGIRRMTGSGFYLYCGSSVGRITNTGQWRETFLSEGDSATRNEALGLRIMIMDGGERRATDARDKLFALRGIASAAVADSMVIDYSRPVERVYVDFTKKVLTLQRDLRLLSLVRQGQRQKSNLRLPSWVPDWSVGIDDGGVLQRYYRFEPARRFRAALDTQPQVSAESDHNELSISGIRIGCVASVIDIHELIRDPNTGSISVSKWHLIRLAKKILSSDDYTQSGEPSWVALFRTITADRSALSERINHSYRATFLHGPSLDENVAHSAIPEEQYDRSDISESVKGIIDGKVLFVTDRCLLGLTEQGCCVGDVVCTFLGGAVPFLVRPQVDGRYSLHGEAYVHGLMDGEAFREGISAHEALDVFRIF